jgi:hypothetical protein
MANLPITYNTGGEVNEMWRREDEETERKYIVKRYSTITVGISTEQEARDILDDLVVTYANIQEGSWRRLPGSLFEVNFTWYTITQTNETRSA